MYSVGASRLEQARNGWRGPDRRSLLSGVSVALISALVLYLLGSPGSVDTLIVAGVAFLIGWLFPFLLLGWRWVWVPFERVREDIKAIREHSDSVAEPQADGEKQLPLTVRVHRVLRLGRETAERPTVAAVSVWLNFMVQDIGHDLPDDVATVLRQEAFGSQLSVMERIAEEHRPAYQTRARLTMSREAEHGGGQHAA